MDIISAYGAELPSSNLGGRTKMGKDDSLPIAIFVPRVANSIAKKTKPVQQFAN